MRPRVYVETTIISYLTARPSRDLIIAAQQEATRLWWEQRRASFFLVASDAVLSEAREGDASAAARRLEALGEVCMLPLSDEALSLAQSLRTGASLPSKASVDAMHVAIAAAAGVEYLLTWNCTHIASAVFRPRLESVCRTEGFTPPVICTPQELM